MTSANQTPRIITITTPGPQGIQGPPGFASSGSNTYLGDQIITGSILISGSIIPNIGVGSTTSSFSLGSETAAWKDIYVSEGSIKFIKSGSTTVTLSAANGGISVDGGSVISADGVSGQFITSKSLDTSITVKDSNNSLLMGPIDVETDKEIVVEEGSDLTIFGDIEIQNVTTADTALFAYSASYTDTSSYAVTASYALNTPSVFPYSGSAVITGSLIVNNGTYDVLDTNNSYLNDSNGTGSVLWNDRVLKDSTNVEIINWESKVTNDSSFTKSIDWENRTLYNTNEHAAIDWQNGIIYRSNNSVAIEYNTPNIYGFTSASASIINTTPTGNTNVQVAFAQTGSNFFIYVYMGGQWRSASLS
jgi:hypothetical protein